MTPCPRAEADLIVKGAPMLLDAVPEYFLAKNIQGWGGAVVVAHGETWDSLANILEARFGQHIWHPSHWEEEHKTHG